MQSIDKIWIVSLIVLCTSVSYFNNEERLSLLLVGLMAVSPIVLLRYAKLSMSALCLFSLSLWMILSQIVFHADVLRWSTLLFGVLYCVFFCSYELVLAKSNATLEQYQRLLRGLIYSYTIVLLLQQLCVLLGLPVINASNYDVETPWKLNSLTSEPSHSAVFLSLMMASHVMNGFVLWGKESLYSSFRRYPWLWASFLWSMLTMLSASAVLFVFLTMTLYVRLNTILKIGASLLIALTLAYQAEVTPVVRAVDLIGPTLTLDERRMVMADHSGSLRVLPGIVSLKQINLLSPEGWIGKGIDYGTKTMYESIPGVPKGYTGGGMLLFALEYGMLSFLIIAIFSFRKCYDPRHPYYTSLLWGIFVILMGGMNMQITWACIVLLFTNKELVRRFYRQ